MRSTHRCLASVRLIDASFKCVLLQVVFCWLYTQSPNGTPLEDISRMMLSKRRVRKNIHLQPNVAAFIDDWNRKAASK